MEYLAENQLEENKGLLSTIHLTQLLNYITGLGGFIAPLVMWLLYRKEVQGMEEHGRSIINLQLTIFLLLIFGVLALFWFGIGILPLIFAAFLGFILPITNSYRARKGKSPSYFMTIRFF